ncbi:hypothetical protein SAMD00020551_0937 [Mesobacillus selenatarsenatis SF-1]|uniref:Uncharacterized protein n=1 Tax=Mesobacillus selenatarsenatis (strain DSM 18680 / JCM 14380 / FERM P-15431 / SF-1) TaxID=1321606 RepID=A0A0A8X197_MESS1|nr:hypothetical protein SAMD00020551_0937 [Mesobacillus selenatarsenatis SF-1]
MLLPIYRKREKVKYMYFFKAAELSPKIISRLIKDAKIASQ